MFSWVSYLPRGREVEDKFFAEMVGKLYERLSRMLCLRSAHDTWELPGSLIIPGAEQQCRFGEVVRQRCRGLDFVHDEMKAGLAGEATIFEKLGCLRFSADHLLLCLDDTKWIARQVERWPHRSPCLSIVHGVIVTES